MNWTETLAPAVVVHGFGQARTAMLAGPAVTLLSSQGAALFAGAGWWKALAAAARASAPGCEMVDLLDCADAPGRAMEALRIGLRGIVLDPACPAFAAVQDVALQCGARLLSSRPAALDLAEPGAERRLAAWLRGDSDAARR